MAKIRVANKTLLIVGEGYHEVAFLNHVKSIYAPRGCGLHVTIKNAYGKGALHVVEHATRLKFGFDTCAAMLDTDTDFTQEVHKLAREHSIEILSSEPCFEAVLLRILGRKLKSDLKKQILPFVDNEPKNPQSYVKYFSREVLEVARKTEESINRLIDLFE